MSKFFILIHFSLEALVRKEPNQFSVYCVFFVVVENMQGGRRPEASRAHEEVKFNKFSFLSLLAQAHVIHY